jgi:hypothetical protein
MEMSLQPQAYIFLAAKQAQHSVISLTHWLTYLPLRILPELILKIDIFDILNILDILDILNVLEISKTHLRYL